MYSRKRIIAMQFITSLLILLLMVGTGLAQPPRSVYLPLVWQAGVALEPVATITMPFEVYNAVQPTAVQAVSGYWYISVYRVGSDATGSWIVRWKEGETQLTVVGGAKNAPSVAPVPDGPYSDARGTLACSRSGAIYQFSWQGNSNPKLFIGRLVGDSC